MKKTISVMLILAMMLTVCIFSVNATTAPAGYIGDANCDGSIDVSDATFIMRVVLKLKKQPLSKYFWAMLIWTAS